MAVDIQTSTALFDRVFEYLDLQVDIEPGTRELDDVRGEVRFDGVWFRYGDEWTLRDVDITVPPGTRTALVGETGAGKTSLGYLAARLYDPEQGAVRDRRHRPARADLRRAGRRGRRRLPGDLPVPRLACARTCASPSPEATDEEIEDAARAAQIHDKIAALPDGYDTVVGERGFRFSGGEKQRIAIARTILRNPPVLVLDEATSRARRGRPSAPSARRWRSSPRAARRSSSPTASRRSATPTRSSSSTSGEVAERGTHEELLALGGRYAALVARDEGSAVSA